MAPPEIIKRTFEATTEYAINVEAENRAIGRRHYKSIFPFLQEKQINNQVPDMVQRPFFAFGNRCPNFLLRSFFAQKYAHVSFSSLTSPEI